MTCPKCQTQNPEGAKFCVSCGIALVEGGASTTSPQTPSPTQPIKKSRKKKFLIAVVVFSALVFLVAIVSRACYLRIREYFPQTAPTPTTTKQFPSFPTTVPTPTPRPPATPIQTVGTEFQGISAILTEVTRKGGVVTVKFTLKASNEVSDLEHGEYIGTKIGTTCQGGYATCMDIAINKGDIPYSLVTGFLVDDANQMKYEVLKDASGNYLASTDILQMLKAGESISLYAQFTAPPTTSKSVTINFPKIQPFTGISLE